MNVQELIERIEGLPELDEKKRTWIDKEIVLGFVNQLDEPEKVTIPQFVADIIEGAREENPDSDLADTLQYALINATIDFASWFDKKSNRELFARACILGYEVEKEKRYTVVMKATKQPLYYNVGDKKIFFSMGGLATNFTKKQLQEAGFGEVFNSPLFEVEEDAE